MDSNLFFRSIVFFYFYCLLWSLPSGISCKQMAMAREMPNLMEAPKPEPMANPSGKLWSAKPILTMTPVFSKELLAILL